MLSRDRPPLPRSFLPRGCWAILILMAGVVALLSLNLGGNDLVAGDEGYYGVMALNVGSGAHALINPSLSPLGPPGDKPFLYPLVLAAAVRLGGVDEIPLRLVTVILAVFVALLLCLIGQALGNRVAGMWAALLWLTSPMLAHVARRVAAEPLAVALALAGLWLFLRSIRRERWPYAFGAGVLFGLGFLAKLWLVLIPAGAVVVGAWLANLASAKPERVAWPAWWGLALALLCGFTLTGSIQLVMCWLVTPQHLDHWRRIYFGVSLSDRLAGSGFAYYWHKPVHYYVAVLAQRACLCIPMAGLGVVALLRRRGRSGEPRLATGLLLMWLLALVPMSIPSVKAASYVLPVLPAVFLLAGFGIKSLVTHLADSSLSRRELLLGALLAVLGSTVSLAVLARGQEQSNLGSVTALAVQTAWIAGVLLAAVPWRRGPFLARLAIAGCLSIAVAGGIAQQVRTTAATDHVTAFARIAQVLEPGLRDVDPTQLCFMSPEWASMSFYTFRSGRYWESPYVEPDPDVTLAALRGPDPFFFVVPTGATDLYGGRPSPRILRTIIAEAHSLDLGLGHQTTVRVYVNEPLHLALAGLGSEK